MKYLSILSLLFLTYKAYAYDDCKHCAIVTVDDGIAYGVEHNKWCVIDVERCEKENQCSSFPEYECCEGCKVVYEDEAGKWGVENKRWCGIKDSCFEEVVEEIEETTEEVKVEDEAETEEITEDLEDEEEQSSADEEEKLCKNPLITDIFSADPAPMVYNNTLYLYTSHDEDETINDFYTMKNWYAFSTTDMENWTNHGPILSLDDIEWAIDRAWAPQCVERNGKFYFYFPAQIDVGGMAIGVAVGDSPIGPFKEIGKPLVFEDDWNDFDPTVFIDDDGQAYLYFGNPELRYVLLNEDMISYNEEVGVVKVPITVESFGPGTHSKSSTGELTAYTEGPWLYKRNGIYYLVYSSFRKYKEGQKDDEDVIESISYATSDSPTGPWKYGGLLMDEEGDVYTNHAGVIDYKGKSYIFYHSDELPGGNLFQRSVCVKEFEYNEDGSIDQINKCKKH